MLHQQIPTPHRLLSRQPQHQHPCRGKSGPVPGIKYPARLRHQWRDMVRYRIDNLRDHFTRPDKGAQRFAMQDQSRDGRVNVFATGKRGGRIFQRR